MIIKWLAERDIDFFTPSTAKAPQVTDQLAEVKRELRLDEPVRTSRDNPMIFFALP
ncbi:hypothetical protein [Streptomyces sp. KR80]|uniref:hypothetical protein n=1 Tax=Streptomyces sp. KR80 TaxID=3457426 RepID=UPI003FD1B31D